MEHIVRNKGATQTPTEDYPPLLRGSFFVLLAAVFLIPLFFVPGGLVGLSAGKVLLFILLSLVSFILWIFAGLQKGEFRIPSSWVMGAFSVVALAYVGAALFSDAFKLSFFGRLFEVDTALMFVLFAIVIVLVASLFRTHTQLLRLHGAFFAALFVVALFQITRLIFGADFLSFDFLTTRTANLVGKWSDMSIFFALGVLLLMVGLEFLDMGRVFKVLAYAGVVVGLFFVALTNSVTLWIAIGLLSLVFFVYMLSFGEGNSSSTRRVSGVSVALIVIALVFVISGGSIGAFLNDTLGVRQIEARPSWATTLDIGQNVLSEHPFFGIGPNRFSSAWIMHKPAEVNSTVFWNTDFSFGVGFIPTSIIETGIAGALAWALFFALFIFMGFKSLFIRKENDTSRYLLVGSFFAALFLWLMTVISVPGIAIIVLALFFTGAFVSSLRIYGLVEDITVRFSGYPALNFAAILISVIAVVFSVAGGYFASQRLVASTFFNRGISAFDTAGDIDTAEDLVVRAAGLEDENDEYLRTLAFLQIARLNVLPQRQGLSNEELQEILRTILSRAIQSSQSAVAINPSNYQNWMALGSVYASVVPVGVQGAYEEAKSAYERALELNPHNPALYLSLARLEVSVGDTDAARMFIEQALAEKENYTEAIFLLSQIEIAAGNTTAAIRSVESAALLSPNDPTVFFQLGLLKYNSADYTGAVSAFERAVALNRQYSNARYFLGLSYEKVGRDEDAVAQFEVIQELNPDNSEVSLILDNLRNGRDPFAGAQPPLDGEPESRETLPLEE